MSFIKEDTYAGRFETQIIYTGKVVSIDDNQNIGKIKVRIPVIDTPAIKDDDDEALSALPLLPGHFNILPKVGERVFIFIERLKDSSVKFNQGSRYWVGPIVSQPQDFDFSEDIQSRSRDRGGTLETDTNLENVPDSVGVYPSKETIFIHGRDNNDIVFRDREIILRAGKGTLVNRDIYNKQNPGYIQIRFGSEDLKKETVINTNQDQDNQTGVPTSSSIANDEVKDKNSTPSQSSVINLVADKINILSHDSGNQFNLVDREKSITVEEQIRINTEAHPLVHGDTLVEFLTILKDYVLNHGHPWHGHPSIAKKELKETFQKFKIESMLNKNIKIS